MESSLYKGIKISFPINLKLLIMVVLLSSCVSNPAPREIYNLTAPSNFSISGSIDAQLLVVQPKAVLALNSKSIAVISRDNQISYFPQAAWSDDLSNLIQTRIVEAFQSTDRVKGVGTPGQGMTVDYRLVTEISEFQFNEDDNMVHVAFFVKIINERDGVVLASDKFTASEVINSKVLNRAVKGMNTALDRILIEIVKWSFIQLEPTNSLVEPNIEIGPSS